MSASVWFEEVNKGLLKELKDTIKIKNAKGVLAPLPKLEHAVIVRKPEEDFKFEVFPCVSIYNIGYKYQVQRHLPLQYRHTMVENPDSLEVEELAVPFDLEYQIDFWARYQSDMDIMTRLWLMKHYRQFNLPVIDDGGTSRTVNVLQEGSVVKSDLVLNKERLFHTIIKYVIWVEIDDEIRYTIPKVGSVGINLCQKT